MEIKKSRVSISLTEKEQKTFVEMVQFAREFHQKANSCNGLSCIDCPLSIFCGGNKDDEYMVTEARKSLEDFLNGL
jgi:hypothetical protein